MQWMNRLAQRWAPDPRVAAVLKYVLPPLDRAAMAVTRGRTTITQLTFPTLTLTTLGRRSGQRRQTPLMYLRDGDDLVVVGTNFGQAHHPAWSHNLLATPDATVAIDGHQLPVQARLIDDPARRARLWPQFDAMYSGYRAYRSRTQRDIRMFALEPRSETPDVGI